MLRRDPKKRFEMISEWAWICLQWPISLSKWIVIGPDLKERAKRFEERAQLS
jgi:hypothetical protein